MYKEENEGATKGLLILILIAICISGGFIFGIKYQKQEYEKNKKECPICNEEKVYEKEEKNLDPLSSYNLVDINYEVIESVLKDLNYESKTCTNINDNTSCYIINIINNNTLLSNDKFKFALTFRYGYVLYSNLYTLTDNNEIKIKEEDFEKIYNNIYDDNYKFEKENSINYDYNDNYIIGKKYNDLETKYLLSNNSYEEEIFKSSINSINLENNTYTNISPYELTINCKSKDNHIYLEAIKIESNSNIGE